MNLQDLDYILKKIFNIGTTIAYYNITIKFYIMRLVGKTVIIISDNDNYEEYKDMELKITHATNKGPFYDDAIYPEKLCDLKVNKTGEKVPFALYEYEFKVLN